MSTNGEIKLKVNKKVRQYVGHPILTVRTDVFVTLNSERKTVLTTSICV